MFNKFHLRSRRKHVIVLFLVLIFSVFTGAFFLESNPTVNALGIDGVEILEFDGTYDWETTLDVQTSSSDYITYSDYRDTYCMIADTASECASAASGKKIRFDTAEELYRWSMDVSFEEVYPTGNPTEDVKLADDKIAVLLDLDFVLGDNIDYSVMQSKAFVPIGFAFNDVEQIVYERSFTGTFDGQGFEIQNLYVAGYEHLIYTDYVDEVTTIEIALSEHYSMFNYNEGTINNLGLVDAELEILELHTDITKLSNLVGFNMSGGLVDNVYVLDTRTDITAGMRYQVGTSSAGFEAAGIVHTNQGTLSDAYYVSPIVINANYINKFDVQPVVYTNTGTLSHIVYDSQEYLSQVSISGSTFIIDTPNGLAMGETTNTLKSASSSLNQGLDIWYFYPSDGYPLLQGFSYDDTNDVYEIDDPVDLTFFSKVLGFSSVAHSMDYSEADYVITGNMDMSILAPGAYKTPSDTFTGSLSGYNSAGLDLADNYYIYNLDLESNVLRGTDYYGGLFTILGSGSEISNLNFSQSIVQFNDTDENYSYDFYIGAVAGKMTGGTISNVLVDVDIDMGTEALGQTYCGGIVGIASGVIEYTSNFGDIDAGNHVFASEYSIETVYNIGGVVGAAETAKLVLNDVVNHGNITGMGTSSTISLASGYTDVKIRIGGVIGYIYNSTGIIHEMTDIANFGDITTQSFESSVGVPAYQYIGGVFGKLEGLAPVLEENSTYKFANFYNEGNISHTYDADTATIKASGIGTNCASEAIEYALLFNHGTFDFTEGAATYTQTQFKYAALIYDVSSSAVTISRAYNYGDLTYDTNIFTNISGIYTSDNDVATLLRYVANYGDIEFLNNSGLTEITLADDLVINGITSSTNVNYLNVYNYGDIDFVNIDIGSNDVYIAGITVQLSADKYMRNSLNDGDITFAEISGSGNIYIAGMVNTNFAGDLQDAGQSTTQPQATEGIIDSINSGSISTSYGLESASLYGVHGTSNTFIGGVVTLNKGSIQDSSNLGNISAYNSYTSSTFTYETTSYFAGLVNNYTAGLVAGGIASAVIGGDSRIYDTANNGDVILTAYRYVRAGGILGVALYDELDAGNITSGMGLVDDIEDSILTNGVNLGNISALSNIIASYSLTTAYKSFSIRYGSGSSYSTGDTYGVNTVEGNDERVTIYSSAGGVIGYGLSEMKNMLNHGTISATDVAGGVVGATYVLGGSTVQTTVVHITTAINYGDIKAVDNSDVSSINKYSLSVDDVDDYYMADGNTFLFPTLTTALAPGAKRGFGGIFGRLQRGLNGVMTSEGGSFDFIVNANPNIDLIGRLDQVDNFSSSSRYFRFNDAIYYSAKDDDLTQAVFTGFYIVAEEVASISGSRRDWDIYYDEIIFEQVGIVMTEISDLSTNNYFHSTSYWQPYDPGEYLGAYYYQQKTVPWITEDEFDPDITNADDEYMYDADFPMRTDPDLTEYIYYMTNDLLASRFTTARPNGMYVLSTSAGRSYGSVIPKNIDIAYVRMIDEDYTGFISLLMDYSIVSPVIKKDLDTAIETAFDNLKQTTFNDKAEIIPNDSVFVTITEDNGSNTVLSLPDIDYINKTVTFSISMEAFNSSQTSATYSVTNGLISSSALIAERVDDYYGHAPSSAELTAYRALLYPEKDLVISTNYPADLSVTLPSYSITSNVTYSIGYMSVFSEAFLGDDLYAHSTYYSDYELFIEFTPTSDLLPGTTEIETVEFNGGAQVNVITPTDIRGLGDVDWDGTLTLYFEDNKGLFTQGYDFKDYFVIKYTDGTIVDSSNYTVTSTAVDISGGIGYYDITFEFIEATITGDYYFEYSFFPTSTVYTCYFDKDPSDDNSIIDFSYYSEEDSISFNAFVITSYINIGYDVESFMDTGTSNFSANTNLALPSYVSNITYDIDFMTSDTLEISPFAEVISASLISVNITSGYKTWQMEYVIEAEDGTQAVYTHNLIERSVDLVSVLKDGNDVPLNDVFTSREATSTEFTVDLGFDHNLNLYVIEPGAYSYLEVSVTGTTNDGLTTYTPAEIIGITYDTDDDLLIYITYETLPGIYTFTFTYYRDGSATEYVSFASTLEITKNLGTYAYLSDIDFSQLVNETSYPDISITDAAGETISSTFIPAVYFDGIDYDGSDEAGVSYYKIDGRVSNVPLDSYVPYFLDFLPYGGTVSRYAYDQNTTSWYWTDEADANSDEATLSQLIADYTVFPDTLQEPQEGEEVMVKFRVKAEDGLSSVYYYITVTDITFNLSIVFDIYYCTDETEGSCVLAEESVDFTDELVIITVKNLATDGDDTVSGVTIPDNFPTFTTITALNNRMNQFHYIYDVDYEYKFGRNMAGFYTFEVELPLDQYLNDLYTYEIEYGDHYLNDASDYVTDLEGKYYYIEYATHNRTRRFNIFIRAIDSPTVDAPYGLFDFFKSWFNE